MGADDAPAAKRASYVAIIMDGNGRWAAARGLPRHAGHKEGVEPVRMSIRECMRHKIGALTLFAFSSENWGRPSEEVGALMGLFVQALEREIDELHENGVRLRFIGDRQGFPVRLQASMRAAEERTVGNVALRQRGDALSLEQIRNPPPL